MNIVERTRKQAKRLSKQTGIRRKQALETLARDNGFVSWKAMKDYHDVRWYPCDSPFLNHWFSTWREAQTFHDKNGGYLLTYRGHYFVCQKEYIVHLGLDPLAPYWQKINYSVCHSRARRIVFY